MGTGGRAQNLGLISSHLCSSAASDAMTSAPRPELANTQYVFVIYNCDTMFLFIIYLLVPTSASRLCSDQKTALYQQQKL